MTLHGEKFQKLVGETLDERRDRLLTKRNMFVDTTPEIADAIAKSKLFSCK